jgi:hypothetical protein
MFMAFSKSRKRGGQESKCLREMARKPSPSLLVLIDDATGRLVGLLFVKEESFHSYARLVV